MSDSSKSHRFGAASFSAQTSNISGEWRLHQIVRKILNIFDVAAGTHDSIIDALAEDAKMEGKHLEGGMAVEDR